MSDFSEQFLKKPKHLKNKSLIAIIGLYEQPLEPNDPINPLYSISQLAFNELESLVQVYVEADNASGLNKFKTDYPNYLLKKDGTLDNPQNWMVLAFPSETMPDESTPLDNFYQVRGKELEQTRQEELIKNKEENK